MNITKNIKNIAQDVLINKSGAIDNTPLFSDNDFGECVNENYSSKSRIVITGVGKNAIIANKIVAALSSTVCFSKSSNSSKLKALSPLLKRRGSKLVARVFITNLYLERCGDYAISGNALEACSYHWIPAARATHNFKAGNVLTGCS